MTEDCVSFQIDGYCQPKQRTFGKSFITPPETRAYEKLVKTLAKVAMKGKPPTLNPVGVLIDIECTIPKSFSKKKKQLALDGKIYPTVCDLDNCGKSILDGLNRIAFEDDRQIQKLSIERKYGPLERVFVTVFDILEAA